MVKARHVVWLEPSPTDEGYLGEDGALQLCIDYKTRRKPAVVVAKVFVSPTPPTIVTKQEKQEMDTLVYAGAPHGTMDKPISPVPISFPSFFCFKVNIGE